jgi:serine/threonine-protein kinase
VHRDLKPENIFLVRERHGGVVPKLLDFGISKLTGGNTAAMTGTAASFGTPYYMPPEQVRGARQVDQRSDVYALGVVLYETLTGSRPFEADNIYTMLHAIGSGTYPPPRQVRPDLSIELEAVIVRAMNVEPAGRFQSVRELAAALLPFASDKARLLWSETFGAAVGAPALGAAAPATSSTGPIRPGSVSGTRLLPTGETVGPLPGAPGAVTLGSASGYQLERRPAARSKIAVLVGGALAVGALVLIGAKVVHLSPAGSSPSAEPAAATPASAPVPRPAPASYRVDVDVTPATAALELDGVPGGVGTLTRELVADGRTHRLVGHAPGYRDVVVKFVDAPPDRHLRLEPETPARAPEPEARAAATRHAPPSHPHHHQSHPAPAPTAAPEKPRSLSGAPVLD